MELSCKRRFEYVKVVPLSRYLTGLRALFRDDQVVMQPTMITIPSLPSLPAFPSLLLSLASSALSKLSLFFLITSDLNKHFGATSASLRIEDSLKQSLHTTIVFIGYSQVMSLRPSI